MLYGKDTAVLFRQIGASARLVLIEAPPSTWIIIADGTAQMKLKDRPGRFCRLWWNPHAVPQIISQGGFSFDERKQWEQRYCVCPPGRGAEKALFSHLCTGCFRNKNVAHSSELILFSLAWSCPLSCLSSLCPPDTRGCCPYLHTLVLNNYMSQIFYYKKSSFSFCLEARIAAIESLR